MNELWGAFIILEALPHGLFRQVDAWVAKLDIKDEEFWYGQHPPRIKGDND